ncbi:SPRY-domain-containing protein [Macrolepiota fuliginosa MF-IS2]|uniref:SPRY-domain-containing protein n=1 Tax=Macrolepiota fuliginosa MF-IS2 TaxID=1400762 RepID=A0A9P5XNP6_9AGAR|nr:SPRY-domain-containing protein [Macrolepiota fuliginosa MF-IS2]
MPLPDSLLQSSALEPPDSLPQQPDALLVLLPLLIVLSTFLFLLLIFLICVLLIRRRRGIVLRDNDGPIDMSREELIEGEGGFDAIEERWLESVDENDRRAYNRAKEYQFQYPPNSLPTDITLSQFLSIQEKGVSAWSFEPDYETVNSLLVHARTEITFLPDPASSSCVQSNLPLPKLNEVYYWEVKMFDLPEATTVSVGLATKPYPPFRLPGYNRYSVAYHSNGDKSHNYPFTTTQFGPRLKEGDVLGVGYRPRTGTVFFTRNGRKMEDAFIGLSRWNLFPTVGADGPCSVHVNLGQAGFVFIEANVKKWGLAPSVGTLAPPPAYGSERGSILLDVGGRIRPASDATPSSTPGASSPTPRSHRSRRSRPPGGTIGSSPLRASLIDPPATPPPPITPIDEEAEEGQIQATHATSYADQPPLDAPDVPLLGQPDDRVITSTPSSPSASTRSLSPNAGARNPFIPPRPHRRSLTHVATSLSQSGSEMTVTLLPPPDSPMSPNPDPPTPNQRDIHLRALSMSSHRRTNSSASNRQTSDDERVLHDASSLSRRDPPAYSPLDAYRYAEGVHLDLPADVIAAALEGGTIPASAIGQTSPPRPSERRRSRRR